MSVNTVGLFYNFSKKLTHELTSLLCIAEASAETEQAWDGAGEKVGTEVWRIEVGYFTLVYKNNYWSPLVF